MLENISFCSCCRLDVNEAVESQCMFFSFTKRAQKALSSEFLYHITDDGNDDSDLGDKTGIPIDGIDFMDSEQVYIKKLEDNYYRISTQYIHPFIQCLFKYLPAFYVPNDKNKKNYYCNS